MPGRMTLSRWRRRLGSTEKLALALAELLGSAATDLDAAHGRYCTESNALHAAAESGGAQ